MGVFNEVENQRTLLAIPTRAYDVITVKIHEFGDDRQKTISFLSVLLPNFYTCFLDIFHVSQLVMLLET